MSTFRPIPEVGLREGKRTQELSQPCNQGCGFRPVVRTLFCKTPHAVREGVEHLPGFFLADAEVELLLALDEGSCSLHVVASRP